MESSTETWKCNVFAKSCIRYYISQELQQEQRRGKIVLSDSISNSWPRTAHNCSKFNSFQAYVPHIHEYRSNRDHAVVKSSQDSSQQQINHTFSCWLLIALSSSLLLSSMWLTGPRSSLRLVCVTSAMSESCVTSKLRPLRSGPTKVRMIT